MPDPIHLRCSGSVGVSDTKLTCTAVSDHRISHGSDWWVAKSQMSTERLAHWRESLEALFPERHIYVRSGGEMRTFALSSRQQVGLAGLLGLLALWVGVCSAAMLIHMFQVSAPDQAVVRERARSERLVADREARLNSALGQLSDKNGSAQQLADEVTKRHNALAMMLGDLGGAAGASPALAQGAAPIQPNATPLQRIRAVQSDQDRLLNQAENVAKTRGDRLRLALRLAGLSPESYLRPSGGSLGGPLIDAKDPRALAAVLDVDEDFARRIQRVANQISAMKGQREEAAKLPLAAPTTEVHETSGFGVRIDPFTATVAFHAGQDFAGAMYTPIYATAPGTVSFTGVRSGYGNTVEILATIAVAAGQHVALGQRIAAMGDTGRSTGPHLHYEVWSNGRAQNPDRFLKAGEYVQ
jgi:murein DD-endopeptidase MepM/ murein hydrolase activator NlpD